MGVFLRSRVIATRRGDAHRRLWLCSSRLSLSVSEHWKCAESERRKLLIWPIVAWLVMSWWALHVGPNRGPILNWAKLSQEVMAAIVAVASLSKNSLGFLLKDVLMQLMLSEPSDYYFNLYFYVWMCPFDLCFVVGTVYIGRFLLILLYLSDDSSVITVADYLTQNIF